MIPHRILENRYIPAVWQEPEVPIRVLAVYTCWRGSFDTLKIATDALRKKGVQVLDLDWQRDPWLLSGPSTVRFHLLDEIAKTVHADLVILLGANLVLDQQVRDDHTRTYVTYQISSISNLSPQHLGAFTNCHFCYFAHSHSLPLIPGQVARWLPTGCSADWVSAIPPATDLGTLDVLLLWNKGFYPKSRIREKLLRELRSSSIDYRLFGNNWGRKIQSIDAYHAFKVTKASRLVLDHNTNLVPTEFQLNDRFLMAAACGTPVLCWECSDVNRCFEKGTEYFPFDPSKGVVQNVSEVLDRGTETLTSTGERLQKRAQADHDWSTRWAQILYDHFERIARR
ncbi:MAG: glycosyltransferase family protein [Phycisphaerae bacterium]